MLLQRVTRIIKIIIYCYNWASEVLLVVKNPPANLGDPSSISGSGRFPREGISYPLQYSWTYLVAQMVKNLPAMQETWVRSLSWEDPLEEGVATHSSIYP